MFASITFEILTRHLKEKGGILLVLMQQHHEMYAQKTKNYLDALIKCLPGTEGAKPAQQVFKQSAVCIFTDTPNGGQMPGTKQASQIEEQIRERVQFQLNYSHLDPFEKSRVLGQLLQVIPQLHIIPPSTFRTWNEIVEGMDRNLRQIKHHVEQTKLQIERHRHRIELIRNIIYQEEHRPVYLMCTFIYYLMGIEAKPRRVVNRGHMELESELKLYESLVRKVQVLRIELDSLQANQDGLNHLVV